MIKFLNAVLILYLTLAGIFTLGIGVAVFYAKTTCEQHLPRDKNCSIKIHIITKKEE